MKNRCWKGYEPVKGKKPYSPNSCKKSQPKPQNKSNAKAKGKNK